MNFCTLFLHTENVHLMKDVGQLPYCLQNDFGYNSFIVTYNNGSYPYIKHEMKGLHLKFVKKTRYGEIIDGIRFLLKEKNNIDILNIYHLNASSFVWACMFKMIRKKGALTYLKLDANHNEIAKIRNKNLVAIIKKLTINMADIVSAESKKMQSAMSPYCKTDILYIPNGYLSEEIYKVKSNDTSFCKENIILTVGRLGTYPKATDILLESFAGAEISDSWKMILVGSVEKEFYSYIESYFIKHPDLKKKIEFLGEIKDKNQLGKYYEKAKIFALPSRFEGFPIVLLEAMAGGCYIITTDVVLPAYDLINDEVTGRVVKSDSIFELTNALKEECLKERDWNQNAQQIQERAIKDYAWSNILITLDGYINKGKGK